MRWIPNYHHNVFVAIVGKPLKMLLTSGENLAIFKFFFRQFNAMVALVASYFCYDYMVTIKAYKLYNIYDQCPTHLQHLCYKALVKNIRKGYSCTWCKQVANKSSCIL